MKTDHIVVNTSDPIWASNVELLPSEECLPVIGSCQVSSILQNLDPSSNNDQNLQNMDLIILQGNDYRVPLDTPLNLHSNNYIILKDNTHTENSSGSESANGNSFKLHNVTEKYTTDKILDKHHSSLGESSGLKGFSLASEKKYETLKKLEPTDLSLNITETSNSSNNSSISPKHYDKESFEDMLYFVCNLCPFLCTKESKITEHLEQVHKNKTLSKLVQLKCPACANIFYHRASLRSHLLHDHLVASIDLNLIVQAVVFYSNKENKLEEAKITEEEKKTNQKPISKVVSTKTEPKFSLPGPSSAINNKFEISCNISKLNSKDVVNLVKPSSKVPPPKIMDLDSSSEGSENFDLHNSTEANSKLVKCISFPQKTMEKEKIPLPQVDISPNNSEKLITNLMKKTEVLPKVIHLNTHKCAYASCKVVLKDFKKMNYHIDSHCNVAFRCLECQEKYVTWNPLISHLWRVHKIDMELFSCDKCDYKTNSLSKLNNVHKRIHSNDKPFKCEICPKSFKNQKQLRNHKARHKPAGEKEMFMCEPCSKTFTDKRGLKNHMDSVHKKLKPFLCNYCGYKGSCRASLKMHIRSHTGEKPFSCDQCSYSTSDHNSLRRHKRRHTGQKPYKCSYCSYACIQSTTYKVHLKTKHPGLEKDHMFACYMCQFRTVKKDMYTSHLATAHKQKPQVS